MKRVKVKIGILVLALALILPAGVVQAISEEDLKRFAQNNILFYDPTSSSCDNSVTTAEYDNLVVGEVRNGNLESVVTAYGPLAMDMQREWGTPWEVVFAQMVIESNVGQAKTGIATGVAKNGYYNWLGITGSGGENSVGTPYISSNGRKWAQYATVGDMIKDWAGKYIARNGYYDKAFSNLDPNSYNLRGFLNDFIMVYAPPHENDTSSYITNVMGLINGTIKTVRESKGWPSSEQLAAQENIPIGGRHPLGGGGSSGSGGSTSTGGGTTSGGCVKLRSSPNYSGSDYQAKLTNLHDLNQWGGTFKDVMMCSGSGSNDIHAGGCGIMSLYAAYYMFSGQGLNNMSVFEEYLAATRADGYNACRASAAVNYGSNLNAYTQMTGEMLFDVDYYPGDNWDRLVAELQKGSKIIILVKGADGSMFTSGGHYMLLDHYNSEKNMIYLFDPAMSESRATNVKNRMGASNIEYDNPLNGVYVSQYTMDNAVKPREALVLTYDGCYTGGSNVCRSTSDGLSEGGMTYEQAVSFMERYRNEASKRLRGDYGSGYRNGAVLGEGWVYDAGCRGGALNNCVAFSQWFVNNFTTAGPSHTSTAGSRYTNNLISTAGFTDGGQVPKAYAIFSTGSGSKSGDGCRGTDGVFYSNHTGVVLGINTEKNEAYIGEASCGNGFTDYWPGVHIKQLDKITNAGGECGYKYAYPDDKLKLEGLNE